MKVEYADLTDVGMKRPHNEDNYLVDTAHQVYLVCDGMGGHEKGEVAAEIAVTTVKKFFEDNEKDPLITWPVDENNEISKLAREFSAAIQAANWNIFHESQKGSGARKMGTTAVGVAVGDDHIVVAHVGDSRCYRIRQGTIEQVTEDHSLLADYIKHAALTEEEIQNFQYKNIILRALGMKKRVEVDTQEIKPMIGDIYLLCSDGLSGEVEDPEMLQIVQRHGDDLRAAVQELIDKANKHGGRDNITTILVQITGL